MNERYISRREVEDITGLSRSTIYKMMAEGDFPLPKRISRRAVRWNICVVSKWLDERPSASPQNYTG